MNDTVFVHAEIDLLFEETLQLLQLVRHQQQYRFWDWAMRPLDREYDPKTEQP